MAARFRASTSPRRSNSLPIASRWRSSLTMVRAPILRAMMPTVQPSNRARKERKTNHLAISGPPIQPDLAQGDVGVAQTTHLDVAHIPLEEPLVGVMKERNDRNVGHDQFLGFPVELDPLQG